MSASSKLAHAPAVHGTGVVAGEQPWVAVSAPADDDRRTSPACREAEIAEIAWVIKRLSDLGVVVTVVGDHVHFLGKNDGLFATTGMETLEGRTAAVRAALERGREWAEKIARERYAASAAIRRGRAPRASHQRKPASAAAAEVTS